MKMQTSLGFAKLFLPMSQKSILPKFLSPKFFAIWYLDSRYFGPDVLPIDFSVCSNQNDYSSIASAISNKY